MQVLNKVDNWDHMVSLHEELWENSNWLPQFPCIPWGSIQSVGSLLGVHLEEDLLLSSYHLWLSEVVRFSCLLPRVLCPHTCPSFTLLIDYGCANLSLLLCAVPATHQGPLRKVWNKSIPNPLSTMNLLFCLPLAGPDLWSFHSALYFHSLAGTNSHLRCSMLD